MGGGPNHLHPLGAHPPSGSVSHLLGPQEESAKKQDDSRPDWFGTSAFQEEETVSQILEMGQMEMA